ncbi:MAG TPA: rhodanese-like domain-containing protein [Gammaproteobacteria bacterium]|nr:rhodanese-like domain-containing protein [Gammaproteobacteria bacterium]
MQNILPFINHHLALFTALAIVLVILIILEFIKLKRAAARVTPAQVTHLINHDKAVILDIRTTDAFGSGHIVGAISLPFKELKDKLKKIEKFKSQPIVIVCATGAEASKAASSLTQQGFQVKILGGGLRAWRDAEMPLVKG